MPIWHQSPKLTPRYFLETPRLFGYPAHVVKHPFVLMYLVKSIVQILYDFFLLSRL